MAHKVALIPGDGIGPEMIKAATQVIEATGVTIDWHSIEIGQSAAEKYGSVVPENALKTLRETKVALKGFTGTPIGGGYESPNVTLRRALGLFAATRPIKNLQSLPARYQGIDLVVVRELTEDLYAGIEHRMSEDVVVSLKLVTEKACSRIARFAFSYATRHKRKKVTLIHKANIMKKADGLFLRTARTIAEEFPDILYTELIVDNACMQLLLNPYQFDVLLLGNLYGDIVSDLCTGMVGGISAVAGWSTGDQCTIFEALHGNVPHLIGTGKGNPLTQLIPSYYLLRHLDEEDAAARLHNATNEVLEEKKALTPDLGGNASTDEMIQAIIQKL